MIKIKKIDLYLKAEVRSDYITNKTDRQELIKRYENIIKRWNDSDNLKRLFPGKYKEIHIKLEALKSGVPYRVYDATDELKDMIIDMGAKIRDVQPLFDGSMLGDKVKSNYKYKTDIPDFVDEIIKINMEVQI